MLQSPTKTKMSDIFYSSKSCIERAKHHFIDFERQTSGFLATRPYISVIEIDPNTAEEIHKIKLTESVPAVLSNIAFDATINLRSALDQATFAVAKAFCGQTTFIYYPFSVNVTEFENRIKGSSPKLPKEILDIMSKFKSYKGGDSPLWALNQLANTGKHAIISPVGLTTSEISYTDGVFTNMGLTLPFWDRTKNEMIFLRVPKGATAKVNFGFALSIEIDGVEFVGGKPAVVVLYDLICKVERIVMTIEAEARRIGLC